LKINDEAAVLTQLTEWQALLNILTEHDAQDAFKKWHKLWAWAKRVEGDYFERDCVQ
jgi:hypothetical protein